MPGCGFVTVLSFGPMKVISDTRQTPMTPELEFPRCAHPTISAMPIRTPTRKIRFVDICAPVAVTFKWRDYTINVAAPAPSCQLVIYRQPPQVRAHDETWAKRLKNDESRLSRRLLKGSG